MKDDTHRRGVTVVEFLALVAIVVLSAALLVSGVACWRRPGGGRTMSCGNNLRNLGLAVFQYAEGFGGYMPTAYENLWNRLAPFLGEDETQTTGGEVWRCPSDEFLIDQAPWGEGNQCSYAPNADETGAGTLRPEEDAGWSVEIEGRVFRSQYSPFSARCRAFDEEVLVRLSSVATDTVLLAECWRRKTQNSLFLDRPKMKMRETAGVPEVGSRNSLLLKQYTSTKGVTVASRDKVTDAGPFNFLLDYTGVGGSKSTALSRTYHRGKMNVLYADGHVAAQPVDAIAAAPGQGQYSGMKTLADIPYWNHLED